jgi:hypothetical protein
MIGPALGQIAGATGVVHTQVDYKVSSGLASNGVRDWVERATAEMAAHDPEAVVFEIGTNDASIVNDNPGPDGTPEWEPAYRLRVAQMMDLLRGSEDDPRTVLWVGAPPMSVEWRDEGVQELNRVMREEADKRAPDVVYVDAYALFSGEDGEYTSSLRTLSGEIERVRIGDGVHLTEAGANHVSAVLFALLDARWHIDEHADTAQPIAWDQSSGSGESSSGSSSGWNDDDDDDDDGDDGDDDDGGTVGTPAPPPSFETTAPPVTEAPPSVPASTAPSSTPPSNDTPATTGAPPASSTPPSNGTGSGSGAPAASG